MEDRNKTYAGNRLKSIFSAIDRVNELGEDTNARWRAQRTICLIASYNMAVPRKERRLIPSPNDKYSNLDAYLRAAERFMYRVIDRVSGPDYRPEIGL